MVLSGEPTNEVKIHKIRARGTNLWPSFYAYATTPNKVNLLQQHNFLEKHQILKILQTHNFSEKHQVPNKVLRKVSNIKIYITHLKICLDNRPATSYNVDIVNEDLVQGFLALVLLHF